MRRVKTPTGRSSSKPSPASTGAMPELILVRYCGEYEVCGRDVDDVAGVGLTELKNDSLDSEVCIEPLSDDRANRLGRVTPELPLCKLPGSDIGLSVT